MRGKIALVQTDWRLQSLLRHSLVLCQVHVMRPEAGPVRIFFGRREMGRKSISQT